MFEQPPEHRPDLTRPLKALGISCIGLLVAAGLCGLDAHLYPGSTFGGSAFAMIGAVIAVPSTFFFVGSLLAVIIGGILRSFKR